MDCEEKDLSNTAPKGLSHVEVIFGSLFMIKKVVHECSPPFRSAIPEEFSNIGRSKRGEKKNGPNILKDSQPSG